MTSDFCETLNYTLLINKHIKKELDAETLLCLNVKT